MGGFSASALAFNIGNGSVPPVSGSTVFSPYLLLPSQTEKRHPLSHMGEVKLLVAVLEGAIFELDKAAYLWKKKDLEQLVETRAWIGSTEEHWFLSFHNICTVLGVHPGAARKKLLDKDGRVRQRMEQNPLCPVEWQKIPQPNVEIRTFKGRERYGVIVYTPQASYELEARKFTRAIFAAEYGFAVYHEYREVAEQGGVHGCPA